MQLYLALWGSVYANSRYCSAVCQCFPQRHADTRKLAMSLPFKQHWSIKSPWLSDNSFCVWLCRSSESCAPSLLCNQGVFTEGVITIVNWMVIRVLLPMPSLSEFLQVVATDMNKLVMQMGWNGQRNMALSHEMVWYRDVVLWALGTEGAGVWQCRHSTLGVGVHGVLIGDSALPYLTLDSYPSRSC